MAYRSSPNPAALFWLVPANFEARKVAEDPVNRRRVACMQNGKLAFDIGFHVQQYSQTTLVTLGRNGDIIIPGRHIRRCHCSFEIDDLATGIVRLWDQTTIKGTRVIGVNSFPFQPGLERKVVFWPGCNTKFEICGAKQKRYEFCLDWIKETDTDIVEAIRPWLDPAMAAMEDPKVARTVVDDGDETFAPSHWPSKIHTTSPVKLRFIQRKQLGSGSYGDVYRAIDIDTGKVVAVKRQQRPKEGWPQEMWTQLMLEVNIMNKIQHVSIRR